MAQTLALQGLIKITEDGDYNLVIPSGGVLSQSNFPLQNEEIFVFVENLGSVNIYLPPISDFNGAWNCKIYIISKGTTIVKTAIPVEGQVVNYINYFDEIEFSSGSTAYFHISNSENYACWITDGGFKPPIGSVIATLQYENPRFEGYQVGDVILKIPTSPFEKATPYTVLMRYESVKLYQYLLGSFEGSNVKLIEVGTRFILEDAIETQSTVLSIGKLSGEVIAPRQNVSLVGDSSDKVITTQTNISSVGGFL